LTRPFVSAGSTGSGKKFLLKAIEDIGMDHPLKAIFVWAFNREGDRASETISKNARLPLSKRT